MVELVTVILAVSIINGIAVVLYACTSFGQAMLFHIGWHACALATDGSVCNAENLPLSVIYISYAGVLLFPCQLYNLRASVDWPLAWAISLSQQFGLVLGEYVLFSYRSIWITRLLSLIFYGLAIQKVSAMSAILRPVQVAENVPVAPSATATVEATTVTVTSYPLHGFNLFLVGIVGFSSGVFGGLMGTGGPPLIWFAAHASLPSAIVRATFSLGFLLQNMSRLFYIFFIQESVSGLQSLDNLYIFVALCASSMASLAFGNVLARSINQDQFQVLLILLLSGGSVLLGVEGMDSYGVLAVTGVSMALFALVVAAVRYGWCEGHGGCGRGCVWDWDWGCLARLKLSSLQAESTSAAGNAALQIQSPVHPTLNKHNPRAGKKVLSKYDTLRQEDYPPPVSYFDEKDDLDLDGESLHFNLDHTHHGPQQNKAAAFPFPLPAMRHTPPRAIEGGAGSLSFGRLGSTLAGGHNIQSQPQPRNSFGTPSAPAPVGAFYSVLPQAGPGPDFRFAIDDEDVLF